MIKDIKITHAGLTTLEAELEELCTVKRKDLADKIRTARSFGDLSENSEYDEAMNEQAKVESRIKQLKELLGNVHVLDASEISTDIVVVGGHIVVQKDEDEPEEFDIVGSTEANPRLRKISDESPVGSALIGKKIGDSITVTVPNGTVHKYTVRGISKQEI